MRVLALLLTFVSSVALATDVYVNGTNIEGLTNHSFEKVNVRIDEKGDVHIDAPGYSVKRVNVGPEKAPPAEGKITMRYYLVTEQTTQGATEYDIDVFLNGQHLRTLPNNEGQIVTDITKKLLPGKNQVTMQAKKLPTQGAERKSYSKAHLFRVIVGEGKVEGEKVVIEKSVVAFSVTAADTDDLVQQYSFTTR
ncbi:MAG: hypothetical protein IT380_10295 [Myxococcales bacterium]|nr:hypothetical protein [Myxococcales bacterium]